MGIYLMKRNVSELIGSELDYAVADMLNKEN